MNYKKYTQTIMALPHITNSQAGVNNYDAVFGSVFEVYFTLPAALKEVFGADEALLTEHVQSIGGLGTLDKGPSAVEQKFMGTTRTFLAPKLDGTSHELTIKLSLNLRNKVDNYIYKIFKAWNKLGYDIETGSTVIKPDYICDWLKVSIGNRAGDIYREILYHNLMLVDGLTAFDSLDYTANEPIEIEVKFKSDWATETNA
jgi:hypothetical protein